MHSMATSCEQVSKDYHMHKRKDVLTIHRTARDQYPAQGSYPHVVWAQRRVPEIDLVRADRKRPQEVFHSHDT